MASESEDLNDNGLKYCMNYIKTMEFYLYFLITQLLVNFAIIIYVNFVAYSDNMIFS